MLITSLQTRRWVLPKGGLLPNETPRSAAEREALEEAGLEGHLEDLEIGSYVYRKQISPGVLRNYSVAVFPMRVLSQRSSWPEQDRRSTRWFSIAEAIDAVYEDDLKALIQSFDAPL